MKKKIKIRHFLFIILLMGTSLAWAEQDYTPEIMDPISESWRWHSFPELNGKGYRCMAEGSDKSMWFGINEGVMKYDGMHWTPFTPEDGLIGAPVTALCATKDGSIYAGTDKGLSRYINGKWTQIFPQKNEFNGKIYTIYQTSDQSIWVGMDQGALRIKNDLFTYFTLNDESDLLNSFVEDAEFIAIPYQSDLNGSFEVFRFLQDEEGHLWFGLVKGPIIKYDMNTGKFRDASSWKIYTEQDGLDLGNRMNILQQSDKSIWYISDLSRSGVNIFKNNQWSNFSLTNYGGTDINTSILETPDGAIWIGGKTKLHVFIKGLWHIYHTPIAPIPAARMELLYSSDGYIWVAGLMSDVVRLDYLTNRWTTYKDLNYECETVDGLLWFIEWDGGVVSFNTKNSQWKKYGIEDGLIDAPVRLISTRNGDLFASGSHHQIASVAHFNGKSWRHQSFEKLSWNIVDRGVYETSKGTILFAPDSPLNDSPGGIMQYDPLKGSFMDKIAWTYYKPSIVPRKSTLFGETADSLLWLGENKLYVFDGNQSIQITEPKVFTNMDIDYFVSTFHGHLWAGSRGMGVFHYDGQRWYQHTEEDGLVSNNIGAILVDSENSIWVGSMKGISRYDGKTWVTKILPEEIMIEPQNGSIRQSKDGAIWINNRYREWNRRALKDNAAPRTPYTYYHVTRYQLDKRPPNTEIIFYEKKVSQPGNAIISWSGIDPWDITQKEDIYYSYRMDDNEWSAFSLETQRFFPSIKSGRHQFEVRSRDNDFNIDPTPATISFIVISPVYKRAWFITMILIFLMIIGFYEYRIIKRDKSLQISNTYLQERTRELETANKELESFAYSVSHDLRTPLRGINGYAKIIEEDYNDELSDNIKKYFDKIVQASRRMGSLIDSLLKLSRIIRTDIIKENINLTKMTAEIVEELKLVDPMRKIDITIQSNMFEKADRNLIQIVLENLLQNAWKFTELNSGAKIKVGYIYSNKDKIYFVRDNGVGFDMQYSDKLFVPFNRLHSENEFEGMGIGLTNVKKIIDKHGGKIWAEGNVNKGCTFYFTL